MMSTTVESNAAGVLAATTHRLFNSLEGMSDAVARRMGLSLSEMYCLHALHGDAELAVKEIARKMQLSNSRLTRILDGLHVKKLVTREFDPSDRRVVRIACTEKGKNISRRIHTEYLALYEDILRRLQAGVRRTVVTAFEELARVMLVQ